MSAKYHAVSAVLYGYAAITLWLVLPIAGLIGGWYLSGFLGLTFYPRNNLGFLPFALTVCPLTFAASAALGIWLGVKAWKSANGGKPAPAAGRRC